MTSTIPSWKRRALAGIATLSFLAGNTFAQELPTREEMWAIIQQQQKEIEALKQRVGMTEGELVETKQAIEVASEQVEATASFVEGIVSSDGSGAPSSPSSRTSLGGYGELHFNFGDGDEIDFHRWVLFIGHEYNERVRLFSEVELEHSIAGDGKPGEVELEQAYVEFDLGESNSLKAGLFLLPVGLLNETHEPNTFYGVERNRVENAIIPTTWWEGGLAYTQRNENGWAFDVAAHSGLFTPTSGSNAFRIRSGRQKVGEAIASDLALTTRATYSGLPGLQLGFTAQYQSDLAQGTLAEIIDATLLTAHVDWNSGPWGLRALYARWDLSGAAPAAIGADEQLGYYIEPSYRVETENGDFGFFARYSAYDTTAGRGADSEDSFFDLGVNYWPLDNVVFKADIQFPDRSNESDENEIYNLGVGYQF